MDTLTTRPIRGDEDPQCGIERVDDTKPPYRTYMCGITSRIVWQATPEAAVPVCRDCLRWLETLISLGQKVI